MHLNTAEHSHPTFWFTRYTEANTSESLSDEQLIGGRLEPIAIVLPSSNCPSPPKCLQHIGDALFLFVPIIDDSTIYILSGLPGTVAESYSFPGERILRAKYLSSNLYLLTSPGPRLRIFTQSLATPPADLSPCVTVDLSSLADECHFDAIDFEPIAKYGSLQSRYDLIFFKRRTACIWQVSVPNQQAPIITPISLFCPPILPETLSVDRVVRDNASGYYFSDSAASLIYHISDTRQNTEGRIVYSYPTTLIQSSILSSAVRPIGICLFDGSKSLPARAFRDVFPENVCNDIRDARFLITTDPDSGRSYTINPGTTDPKETLLPLVGSFFRNPKQPVTMRTSICDYTDIFQAEDYKIVFWAETSPDIMVLNPRLSVFNNMKLSRKTQARVKRRSPSDAET